MNIHIANVFSCLFRRYSAQKVSHCLSSLLDFPRLTGHVKSTIGSKAGSDYAVNEETTQPRELFVIGIHT